MTASVAPVPVVGNAEAGVSASGRATTLQLWPALDPATEAALRASIERWGVLVPVAKDQHGRILDGNHRSRIADEMGVKYPVLVHWVADDDEAREIAHTLNADRRHLDPERRREMVAALRAAGHSYPAIAGALGIGVGTAHRDAAAFPGGKPEPDRAIGRDGKSYPARRPAVFAPDETHAETATAALFEAERTGQAMAATVYSNESLEYHTPGGIVDAARDVMGGIDLDPATCASAQERIRADRFYTVADDGLAQPWAGRVWLNPPYSYTDGRSNQQLWSERAVAEYEAGRVTECIMLVKAALGYNWFEALWWRFPVCFPRRRLSFIVDGKSDDGQSKQGTALVYIGNNPDRFEYVFRAWGRVVMPEAREWNTVVFP